MVTRRNHEVHADSGAASRSRRGRASRDRWINRTAWLGVVSVLALVLSTISAHAAPPSSDCKTGPPLDPGGLKDYEISAPGQFTAATTPFRFRFDETRAPQSDERRITAIPATGRKVRPDGSLGRSHQLPLGRVDGGLDESLKTSTGWPITESTGMTVGTAVAKGGANPEIRVCVHLDPEKVPNLRPGSYEGAIVVRAHGLQDKAINVTASFRGPRDHAVMFAFGGVLIGLGVRMLAELAGGQRSGNPGALHALRDYVFQWSFPLALVLGGLSGWLGYKEFYDANPTWGFDSADSLKLFGTCFGFQMGSIGGADIAKRLIP